MKFDEIEFEVLSRANPAGCGYYIKGIYADRAKELIKEGILLDTNWGKEGWELSEKGITYRKEFLKKVRKKHKHIWLTRKDVYDDDESENKNEPYDFAFSEGNHNGYKCKRCGYSFCEHCKSEFNVPECEVRK